MASRSIPSPAPSFRRKPLRATTRPRSRDRRDAFPRFADLRGVVVRVRVRAGASEERVSLRGDGTLRAWVRPQRERGYDNLRLRTLLGRITGTAPRRIEILTGSRTPWKLVRIPGISRQQLASRIPKRRGGYRFGGRTYAGRSQPNRVRRRGAARRG